MPFRFYWRYEDHPVPVAMHLLRRYSMGIVYHICFLGHIQADRKGSALHFKPLNFEPCAGLFICLVVGAEAVGVGAASGGQEFGQELDG